MEILPVTPFDLAALAPLVADFRVALHALKGSCAAPDPADARAELSGYLAAGFPCFQAVEGQSVQGYLVCRIADGCVFVESLYVQPECRRQGVATALLQKAEALCTAKGQPTLYFWVHPNNEGMFRFLERHGYNVLNLVEVRRAWPGETPRQNIPVGRHMFAY